MGKTTCVNKIEETARARLSTSTRLFHWTAAQDYQMSKPAKRTSLEDEMRKAFRNAGYGNVDVVIQQFGMGGGYGIATTAEFRISVMKTSMSRKDTSRAASKIYKIVRRKPRK